MHSARFSHPTYLPAASATQGDVSNRRDDVGVDKYVAGQQKGPVAASVSQISSYFVIKILMTVSSTLGQLIN